MEVDVMITIMEENDVRFDPERRCWSMCISVV